MSGEDVAVGIDIGGTGAKGGVVSQDGRVHTQSAAPTSDSDDLPTVLGCYERVARELSEKARAAGLRVAGLGVGVPGLLDPDFSRMTYGNVRPLEGFPLRDHLVGRFGVPVRLDNDANCAALAEYYWGAGAGCERLVVATVGSGIGAGVLIGGRALRFAFGTAGDLGNILVDARGGRGSFLGGVGSLEAVASARAMMDAAAALDPPPANVAELARRAREHEPAAAIIREAGRWLGVGIATWAAIFSPERVLIGGGVSACGELLFEAVRRGVREVGQPFYVQHLEIQPARLGNQAGLLGAASLILKNPP